MVGSRGAAYCSNPMSRSKRDGRRESSLISLRIRRRSLAWADQRKSALTMLGDGRRRAPASTEIAVMSYVLVGARSDAGDEVGVEWIVRQAARLDRGEAGFR